MSVVEISTNGHVRTITLNRPEKKNAINDELAWAVIGAVEQAAQDDNIWVIAITGKEGAFCSGLDLTGGGERTSPLSPQSQQLDDIGWVGQFLMTIRARCDKPVVGGINGVAVGAGLGLAMATDVRLISKSARLMAGYTRIGGSPRFMIENRMVQGDEAVALGMAGEVVEDENFDDRLAEYCETLCQWSPVSFRLLKRGMVKAMTSTDMEQQLRFERANIMIAFSSEDAKEARKAFLEKRAPVFQGK
jgi:2-(1,2-epoxy-1,2-dihydrophenyl)acetyl-CoA isomerase